ncbi:MAG: VWA domain-containing protein [Myxococcales bacterium]|nr:VWA domain-containing protein [Myxococcales bacterium]
MRRRCLPLLLIPVLGLASFACVEPETDDPITYAGGHDTDEGDTDEGREPDLPSDESDSGTDEEETPPTCSSTTAVAENVPPNVVLVVDKSRSMVLNSWDDDGAPQTPDVTRWHSLHQTVASIAEQYQDGMALGLTLFPSVDATSAYDLACLVESTPEVPVALGNADALLAAIPGADDLDLYGATPAAAGIAGAREHLLAVDDGRPSALILITDGAANCGAEAEGLARFDDYDEELPLLVADTWDKDGIPTYVIGIDIDDSSEHPFTNPRQKLDELAKLGGVPREGGEVGFYDAADAQSLMSALDEIAASVACGVQLGQAPAGPDELVITIDGQMIPHLDSCDEGFGWVYANANLTSIELCNDACDMLHDSGEIQAEFTCPPQP